MESQHAYKSDDLLRTSEAARVIGVHAQTLRNYEAAGHIAAKRTLSGERRFRFGDLVELRDNPPELYKRRSPRDVDAEAAVA